MKELTEEIKRELRYRAKHPLHVIGVNDYVVVDIDEKELKEWSLSHGKQMDIKTFIRHTNNTKLADWSTTLEAMATIPRRWWW